MDLVVNMLLEGIEGTAGCPKPTDRILHISCDQLFVITIDVFLRNAMPVKRTYSSLLDSLNLGDIRVITIDPLFTVFQQESEIPSAHRERRDFAWKILESVLNLAGTEIFDASTRGQAIARCEEEHGVARKD